jgi:glycosyltransferase involved in cell wall biosynthesis
LEKGEKIHAPSTQVIIAALNEEEGIGLTISEINDNLDNPRVLVVDGRSTDKAVEVAKDMGAHIAFQDGLARWFVPKFD